MPKYLICCADKYNMKLNELIPLCLEVLKDWRVIVITVFLIFYISLANYVIKYRKKPKIYRSKSVKKDSAPAAPAPAQEASGEQEEAEE